MRRVLLGFLVAIALVAGYVAWRYPGAWGLVRYRAAPTHVVVPVEGVRLASLDSSFGAPRSEGRKHEGIDIFAPRGTRVVSATRGIVARVGQNRLGGNVVWVAGEGATMYYYAHLERFRDGIAPGETVGPGALLGYVGTTGNAVGTPPHLHFGVYPLGNWLRAVDPYPFLVERAAAPSRARPPSRVPGSAFRVPRSGS